MYDIKNLNIWKVKENNYCLECNSKEYELSVSKREETFMTEKCYAIFEEMNRLVPEADFMEIKKRRNGKLRFPMYLNSELKETEIETLDLTVRSSNCIRRASFQTVGALVEAINDRDDLKRIRNCGEKSIDEIFEKLFCYQYEQIPKERKVKFIKRVVELNQ